MSKLSLVVIVTAGAIFSVPYVTHAQQNVPAAVRQAEAEAESAADRFGLGVQGGIGLDPEIINVGAHGTFGPIFRPTLQFRPGIEFGLGEVTTVFGINFDVLYTLPGFTGETRWMPYVGGGPNFGLSRRSFETDEGDHVDVSGVPNAVADRGRFDFSNRFQRGHELHRWNAPPERHVLRDEGDGVGRFERAVALGVQFLIV